MPNPNPRTDQLEKHRFKPGTINSPGRPKGIRKREQSEAHEQILRSPLFPKIRKRFIEGGYIVPPGATIADGISVALAIKALAGDVAAAKELRESAEGKARIRVEVEDKTKQQPRLVVVFENVPGQEEKRIALERFLAPPPDEPKPAIDVAVEAALDDVKVEEKSE